MEMTNTLAAANYFVPVGMSSQRFHAMGTTVAVLLPSADADAGFAAVQDLFAAWESALSRFLPASELSRLNANAGSPVTVGPLLWTVLDRALDAAASTEGRYDPTLGSQLVGLGYDRTFEQVPADAEGTTASSTPGGGWRRIVRDDERRTVTLPAGVGLDFGGIAKGMAVDAALARLRAMGYAAALVNAGGDLAVHGALPFGDSWPIEIAGRRANWTIPLSYGALATSGISRRQWRRGGQARHHLLDPRTGEPVANDLWSVTVVAPTCEQAEVAAKAAFVAGPREGAALLRSYQFAGLFTLQDGTWRAIGSWPVRSMEASLWVSGER